MKTYLALSTLALLAASCSGGGGGKGDSTNDKVQGHWQFQSGPVVSGSDLGTITWLDLDKSGKATLFSRAPLRGTLGCSAGVVAVLNDTVLTLQLPSLSQTIDFLYKVNGDTLTLTDAGNHVSTFKRAASIPAADQCTSLTGSTATALPSNAQATSRSSLASDGTHLLYTDAAETKWLSIDPVTHAAGTPVNATGYAYILAGQGTDLWTDCFCGANSDLQRQTLAGVLVDSVDTAAAPISHEVSISAATYDGSRLWVGGYDYAAGIPVMAKLNTDAEPDTLDTVITLDGQVNGLAFVGGSLYGLVYFNGFVLVKMDPSSGTVLTTYSIPQRAFYAGLAVAGGKLYALASDDYTLFSVIELDI